MSANKTALQEVSGALQKFKPQLELALPKDTNIDREISSVLATVANSQELQKCSPKSIAMSAYTAATLGLPVNALGLAYLVPYGGKAQLQIGYKGYIKLVSETGYVESIDAECVYEKDVFEWECGSNPRVLHKPSLSADRGKMIAVYAVAHLRGGKFKATVMTTAQVDSIKKLSKSGNVWAQHYEEMAKKTVIKRLCKTLPLAASTQHALAQVEAVDQRIEDGKPYTDIVDVGVAFNEQEREPQNATSAVIDAEHIEPPREEDVQMSEQELIMEINGIQNTIIEIEPSAKFPPLTGKTRDQLSLLLDERLSQLHDTREALLKQSKGKK